MTSLAKASRREQTATHLDRKFLLSVVACAVSLSACAARPDLASRGPLLVASPAERNCLTRAMYFESNRSSKKGLLAVGTVVMNRASAPEFPHTICGVVAQPGQFAKGVLSLPMNGQQRRRVARMAEAILAGERQPGMGDAKFFHRAGLIFHYPNMHYVLVAGGNAFYEKIRVPRPGDHIQISQYSFDKP